MSTLYIGLVSFGLSFYLGRVLGPEGFGTYAYILTLASLFLILQDGGYKNLIYREKTLPSSDLSACLDHLLPFALGHALAVTLAGFVLALLVAWPEPAALLAAVTCFGAQAVVLFISSEIRARGRFVQDALWQAAARTMSGVSIVAAVVLIAPTPFTIFAAWSLGLVLCLIPGTLIRLPRPRLSGYWLKAVRGPCLAFMAVNAATTVYYRCDIILLQHMTDFQAAVGQYAAAYRFLDGVVLLAGSLGAIWFRDLRLLCRERQRFWERLKRMLVLMLSAAVVIAILGTWFNQEILLMTFGGEFAAAAALLPWLLAALIFILPNTVLTQAAIAQNREGVYALAASLGLNLILIPGFGSLGAAWATVATEASLSVCLLWGLVKKQ